MHSERNRAQVAGAGEEGAGGKTECPEEAFGVMDRFTILTVVLVSWVHSYIRTYTCHITQPFHYLSTYPREVHRPNYSDQKQVTDESLPRT